jgi:hypothetical protein
MRISIVFDNNGTILAAWSDAEKADETALGPGESSGYVDIPDGMPDAELHQAVERLLVDIDASALKARPGRKEPNGRQQAISTNNADLVLMEKKTC